MGGDSTTLGCYLFQQSLGSGIQPCGDEEGSVLHWWVQLWLGHGGLLTRRPTHLRTREQKVLKGSERLESSVRIRTVSLCFGLLSFSLWYIVFFLSSTEYTMGAVTKGRHPRHVLCSLWVNLENLLQWLSGILDFVLFLFLFFPVLILMFAMVLWEACLTTNKKLYIQLYYPYILCVQIRVLNWLFISFIFLALVFLPPLRQFKWKFNEHLKFKLNLGFILIVLGEVEIKYGIKCF